MVNMKNLSISVRLSLLISLVTLICISSLVLIVRDQTMRLADHDAEQIAQANAEHYAQFAQGSLEATMKEVRSFASSVSGLLSDDGVNSLSREQLHVMLKSWLDRDPNLVGVSMGFEPDAIDGRDAEYANTIGHDSSGRFVPYWYRDGGQLKLEPLVDYATEDYYVLPVTRKQEVILEPYLYNVGGKEVLMTSLMVPIIKTNGQCVGVVGADIPIANLSATFSAVTIYDSGFLNLYSDAGSFVATKDQQLYGKNMTEVAGIDPRYVQGVEHKQRFNLTYFSEQEQKSYIAFGVPFDIGESGSRWVVSVNIPIDEIYAGAYRMAWMVVLIGVVTLVLLVIAVMFISRSISRPVNQGLQLAQEIAKGDLSQRLNLDRGDEIGRLAKALDQMADSLSRSAASAEEVAQGNLAIDIELASPKDQLGQSLKTMVANLNDVMGQVQMAGAQIASGSSQVADSSQSLSQGATESAASLEEISSSMTQMGSQTRLNADNASQASQISTQVTASAQTGNQHMVQMVEAMGEINDASQSVAKIIKVIDEIAFQTNLLALNAAVEAARAGQHGKGFAVVAEEVRNLAARSAKAASETAGLIEGSVGKVEAGSMIADKTAESLAEIVSGVGKVTDLVSEIAAASSEQAEGIAQVNQGLTQIDQVTQQNTANAEESAAASEELSSQADHLQQQLSRFKLQQGSVGTQQASTSPVAASAPSLTWGD